MTVVVAFWAFCAVCYLTRDHPEFDRILATLWAAAGTQQRVVFAIFTWPVESETETWNKILDVRPV